MPSWSDIVNQFVTAWQILRDAPVPTISALVVAFLLIWGALSWRYSGQLENKDSIIATRDATIKYQEAQISDYNTKLEDSRKFPHEIVEAEAIVTLSSVLLISQKGNVGKETHGLLSN